MDEDEVYLVNGEEIVITGKKHVQCDGGNGLLGHPIEYLTLAKGGEAVCKYCDRRYLSKRHPAVVEVRQRGQRFAA